MLDEKEIPLFDCVTHPTPDGHWLDPHKDVGNTVDALRAEMGASGIRWAFAIGMAGVGGYEEATYSAHVREQAQSLFPVAYLDFSEIRDAAVIEPYLARLVALGYAGIKIHPRRSAITLDDVRLPEIITAANRLGLVVLLCTYFWESSPGGCKNNLHSLQGLLARIPDERVVLVHGGAVQLLETMELARAFKSVLLDLSLTICKYAGSSLDLDIKFLFQRFDRRICVGSDSPEFSMRYLRERFDFFADGINREKVESIAYKNIFAFLGLKPDEIPG